MQFRNKHQIDDCDSCLNSLISAVLGLDAFSFHQDRRPVAYHISKSSNGSFSYLIPGPLVVFVFVLPSGAAVTLCRVQFPFYKRRTQSIHLLSVTHCFGISMNIRAYLFQEGKSGTDAIFCLPQTQKQDADGPSSKCVKSCSAAPPSNRPRPLRKIYWTPDCDKSP